MILSKVNLTGFRNFKSAEINLAEKVLVIGANEVGKTNLIWAIRLLLDKTISEYDREIRDHDFYAFDDTDTFSIRLEFTGINEECILSRMKEKVSDDGRMLIILDAKRDPKTGVKTSTISVGHDDTSLEEIEDRYYLKVLNLNYIGSRRDFTRFIGYEKSRLLQDAKEIRTEEQVEQDIKLEAEITDAIKGLDGTIPKLSYIENATANINSELEKLSILTPDHQIIFDAASSDINTFIGGVSLAARSNGKNMSVGGDGRLNQVYLCMWAARHSKTLGELDQVSIVCVEEPEAHLHPHQQRRLAEYLNGVLPGQVIMTSHSPQIASEFSPNSVVRLLRRGSTTTAASNGCSEIIADAFSDFGYRMSIIPAEAFFSDAIFLVEGPSEEQFFKTLASQIDLHLDRLNVSILSVMGVGFSVFVKILDALEIDWVMRTDNDFFKTPRKKPTTYRMAGVSRLISCYEGSRKQTETLTAGLDSIKEKIKGLAVREIPGEVETVLGDLLDELNNGGFFLSEVDLETDLAGSAIFDDLADFHGVETLEDIVEEMKGSKATSMFEFLKAKRECLAKLAGSQLAKPLNLCAAIVGENGFHAPATTDN